MTEDDRFVSIRFRKGVPSLAVKDCVEALRYYCDVLGHEIHFSSRK